MKIDRIEAHVFRAPTPTPVATSFGIMRDRPAVFVKLLTSNGGFGWGEIFANWPSAGAEHRARLLIEDLSEMILGQTISAPHLFWDTLTQKTYIRALQCGEPGPFAQVLAGVDIAVHDLFARRAGLPLAGFLSQDALPTVPVYASGLAIHQASDHIPLQRARGISAFKVKVGFDASNDISRLLDLSKGLQPGETLFADANQAWTPAQALQFIAATRDLPIGWLEEPIAADSPLSDWVQLADASQTRLAGGENITGLSGFDQAISSGVFGVLQPDVAKWGGISGCFEVAKAIRAAGLTYCPHFLGGGIGMQASAHLLAAVGGPGLLELDANPNPLRDEFFASDPLKNGLWHISEVPGLGIEHLPEDIEPYRTLRLYRDHSRPI
ncbi:MAG: mandelate racemase/muconate lactonizing enzyme family protein [Paracoccaceae bacterium]|nr:mandelate racemase/muconate lactonizing enzyme family protein [Paracoccaceae bacterium]